MKYYSEKTKQMYDSVDQLNQAEADHEKHELAVAKQKEERKADSVKVDEARKNAEKAYEDYRKELNEFIKKYGAYHTSYVTTLPETTNLFKIIDDMFDNFFVW